MATTTTCTDCVTGKENEKAHVGKAYKKHCSLTEQHSKLYLQSNSEATATKQMGEQLRSSQEPQSIVSHGLPSSSVHRNKAVKSTATKQIQTSCAKAGQQKQRRTSQE